jgi:hypothetical protein
MLHAVLCKKITNPAIEDSLTASVFERILYLREEIIFSILSKSLITNNILPINKIDYENTKFWPYWTFEHNSREYVEPDMIIKFENYDLIIEAKRSDHFSQKAEQLAFEWLAYLEHGNINKNALLLAVGGLGQTPEKTVAVLQEEIEKIIIQKKGKSIDLPVLLGTSWRKIHETIILIQSDQNLADYENAILSDIRSALIEHGIAYHEPEWFIDFAEKSSFLCNIEDSSINFFENT